MTARLRTCLLGLAVVLLALVFAAGGLVRSPVASALPGCSAGATLDIVAHQDDDLLFQSPTIMREVQGGKCLRTVYVTAGDANDTQAYWMSREAGVRAAYATMAGVANSWSQADAGLTGHSIPVFTLTAAPNVSLAFLRLPDGNIDGSGFSRTGYQSLQKLYAEVIPSISTVDGSSSYTKQALSSSLLSLMNSYQPTSINTLDYLGMYGEGDHSDHYTVAYLTQQAQEQYAVPHTFAGYEGYNIANKASNLDGATTSAKSNAFLTYAQSDYKTCSTASACSGRPEGAWLSRQYAVAASPTASPSASASPSPASGNVAGAATATASSQAVDQPAARAIDGAIDGYPGDYTKEWATNRGRAGSWINLSWASPVTLDRVVLFDRPNTSDRITGGTLTFSDGSTVAVPSLTNSGAAVTVTFATRATSSLRLTATSVSSSTSNAGLAELQASTPGGATTTPVPSTTPTPSATATTAPSATATPSATVTPSPSATVPAAGNIAAGAAVTASSENAADGQTASRIVDGVVDGYPGDYTKEWATSGGRTGSWAQLGWPTVVTVDRVVLYDRPNTSDRVTGGTLTFSDGSTVAVPSLTNAGGAVAVTFSSRATQSVRFTVTSVSTSTANVGLAELEVWAA